MTKNLILIIFRIIIGFSLIIALNPLVIHKSRIAQSNNLLIHSVDCCKDQIIPKFHDFHNKRIFINELLNEDLVYSITTDSLANILVTGSCYRKETDLDVYLTKFSSTGDYLWTRSLNGSSKDIGTDIAVDKKGNIIITGVTYSINFPTTPDAIKGPPRIFYESDPFVTKYSPSGTIMWSTCLGGSAYDSGITSLAVDSHNNIVIVGQVHSDDINISSDCFDPTYNDGNDVFIAKINENGSLIWCTYLGGSSHDYPIDQLVVYPEQPNEIDVVIDSNDNIIVSSSTESDDFPTTVNAFNRTYGGGGDIFLSKFNTTGFLLWSTFIGGNSIENGHSVTVDTEDNILITGGTYSTNFPTKSAYQATNKGDYDIFLSKFSSTGSLLWSTFLGGARDDRGHSVVVDNSNEIYITGRTKSNDYPTTESSYDVTFGGGAKLGDAFLTKLTNSGEVVWSTYIGGEDDDAGAEITIDNNNNLIITGNTASENLESYNSSYLYSFGGLKDGFFSKFQSTGEIISLTRALVVTEPSSDPDNDELINKDEFKYLTDPFNPDTDNDTMTDKAEVDAGLEPLIDDADEDYDADGLTNIEEMYRHTNVSNPDTDGDGMDDWWEIEMALIPYINDTQGDKDDDGMPNYWEYQMGLHANYNDSANDPDNDGLSNLGEYQNKTNPNKFDTDNDSLPDGWEVKNKLDPLNPADANHDSDGDGFPNMLEYQLGFNPQSPIELYGGLFLVFIVLCLVAGLFLRTRKLNQEAVLLGFENNADKKAAIRAGFKTVKERSEAQAAGFLTADIYNIVKAAGWFTVAEMVGDWKNEFSATRKEITDEDIQDFNQSVQESISPLHLSEIESEFKPLFEKIKGKKTRLIQISSLQQSLATSYESSKTPLLIGISLDELNTHSTQSASLLQFLNECEERINNSISHRLEFFTPWSRLLTLIQLTEDRTPVKLSEIANIVNCPEEQAEELITLLLKENDYIGKFDDKDKVYIKGHDVNELIQNYIKLVKEFMEDYEE
ncbi:MAG: SBBP repeat-containing protein [Promethearchaeota archaeon]